MIIWLDPSIQRADLKTDNEASIGISALCDAVHRGFHYLIGDRLTLQKLSQDQNLSATTRAILRKIYSNYATTASILEHITNKITIYYRSIEILECPKKFHISLRSIGLNGVNKSLLIAEDLRDAVVYEHAAKQFLAYSKVGGRISIEKSSGGGSGTPKVFENHVSVESRWCLCITDTDRFCPEDIMSITARRCSAIAELAENAASHLDINARELENIIPLKILEEVIPPTHRAKWDWHNNILLNAQPDVHNYCDIKFGMTLKHIKSFECDKRRAYWFSVIKNMDPLQNPLGDCNNCDHECECYINFGFGENILDLVITYLNKNSPHSSEKLTRNDLLRENWINIGRSVFEWACAPQKGHGV